MTTHDRRSPYLATVVNAVVLVLVVLLFASYLNHRQSVRDNQIEIQRQAVCAVISEIPAGHDKGIDTARGKDHCGKPHPDNLLGP